MKKTSIHEPTTTSRRLALLALALFVAIIGCQRETGVATSSADVPPAGKEEAASARQTPTDRNHPVVVVDTSEGPITLQLDAEKAPGTVRNFLNYVNEGFYNNTLVHYVAPGSMIVAGGYAADRSFKPTRQSIRNEAHNGLKNTRGAVAMARDASLIDSATSQFFINLADAPQRDHQGDTAADYGYCVFGEVTEGLDVAEHISQSPITDHGGDLAQTPNPPVVIKSARIVR